MSDLLRCPACGSLDLVLNPARGDTVCGNCGEVIEESNMVVDVSFGEAAGGGKYLSGRSFQITTRQERSTAKGIQEICRLSQALDLASNIQEPGRRILTLAVQKNFQAGRPTKLVAAACLYLACRRSRSPHLMIDFSDQLRRPVKVIGGTYVKLMERLLGNDARYPLDAGAPIMEVAVVDPSIFIDRFARKLWKAVCLKGHPMKHLMPVTECPCSNCHLSISMSSWMFSCNECQEFVCESCQRDRSGEMMLSPEITRARKQVQNTAMRLIQFMHRDWICVGRRPNGLVGAALLIAAFYHKVRFSAGDIAEVVRIGEDTLRIRLRELMSTAVSTMSREEFESTDVDPLEGNESMEPPCRRRRVAAKLQQNLALEDAQARGALTLEDKAKLALMDSPSERLTSDAEAPSVASLDFSGSRARASGSNSDATRSPLDSQVDRFTTKRPSAQLIQDIAEDVARHHGIEGVLEAGAADAAGVAAAGEAAARMEGLLAGRDFESAPQPAGDSAGSAEGAGKSADRAKTPCTPTSTARGDDKEETLSDIDDEELDMYMLDSEEQDHKAQIWHEVNKDYLEEWHLRSREAERRRRQQEQRSQRAASERNGSSAEHESASDAGSARTNRTGTSNSSKHLRTTASSCTQSAVLALAKKGRKKSRINIDNLEKLFDFDS